MPEASIAELLAAAQRGDRPAFEGLMRVEARRLYRIACRVTGDAASAEDVLQETFLRVLQGRARCRDERAARSWLTRIAVNTAIDAMRRRPPLRQLLCVLCALCVLSSGGRSDRGCSEPGNFSSVQAA